MTNKKGFLQDLQDPNAYLAASWLLNKLSKNFQSEINNELILSLQRKSLNRNTNYGSLQKDYKMPPRVGTHPAEMAAWIPRALLSRTRGRGCLHLSAGLEKGLGLKGGGGGALPHAAAKALQVAGDHCMHKRILNTYSVYSSDTSVPMPASWTKNGRRGNAPGETCRHDSLNRWPKTHPPSPEMPSHAHDHSEQCAKATREC